MVQILHLHHQHARLLQLALDLLLDLVRGGDEDGAVRGVRLGAVKRRVGALDEEDVVPAVERGAAGRADAKVGLHADDDEVCGGGDELRETRVRERVVLALVDDGLVRAGHERELPPGRPGLVRVAVVPVVPNVDHERRVGSVACGCEDLFDVFADVGAVGHALGRVGEHGDLGRDQEEDFSRMRVRVRVEVVEGGGSRDGGGGGGRAVRGWEEA